MERVGAYPDGRIQYLKIALAAMKRTHDNRRNGIFSVL
jgi:hypothetical protein